MPISSVSQSGTLPYIAPQGAAKPAADTDAPDAAASTAKPASAAAPSATPDSSAKPDTDAPSASASGSKGSSAPNMFKINPDGTVGPLHLPRHAKSPGVVHA